MSKILVTGASGQLASCIRGAAKASEALQFHYKTSSELNITSEVEVNEIFQNEKFDYCINCAAYTAVDKAESEPKLAESVNHFGARNLAAACKKYGTVLIHISTDFVFDGRKISPYTEVDKTNPINIYGQTKLQGEQSIAELLEQHFIVRTSWLYSEYGNNFMKSMIRLAKEREELGVVTDQQGTPTYARDLADFLVLLISEKSSKYGIYHFSNMGETSWYGFAKAIFQYEKLKINLKPIVTSEYPTPAKRPAYSVLEKKKLQTNFNFEVPQWEESLKKALKELKR